MVITLWISIQGTDCKNAITTCGFVWPIVANFLALFSLLASLLLDIRAIYYTPPGRPQRTAAQR